MYANIMDNAFISENPYYFNNNNNNNNNKSPKTPESGSKGFSFFRRKSSKSCSSSSSNTQQTPISSPNQCIRSINSATLGQDANALLGSPRGSFGSLGTYPQNFDFQNDCHTIYRQSGIKDKYRDRLGSYNEPFLSHRLQNEKTDDVFLSQTRTNGCKTLPTNSDENRRHSIGNFTQRQRCASLSDEVPRMVAPKPPVISPIKYRSSKRKDFCPDGVSLDDILILTAKNSERAVTWASFLRARFDKITKQRGRKPFNFLHLKIDDGYFSTDLVKKCQTTALQILILCPAVLALPQQQLIEQFSNVLNNDKVLAVLLEVEEKKLLETHKSALPYYKSWRKCYIHQNDHSAIGNILGIATDILGRALCHRPPCQELTGSIVKTPSEAFTVIPKKVRIGQNKILALLNEPLSNDDHIRITIDKNGEIFEIKTYKQRNPFTLQFTIPEACMEISTMIEVQIEKGGINLGSRPVKCESRLREMELLLRTQDNPLEFMSTSLGIGSTDRTALDDHLLKCFQKNMPPNFHLLAGPSVKQLFSIRDKQPEEFPTLLHFAAKYGLEQLCMQLVECPGGDSACEIKNFIGKTPSDIAEQEGFQKLANSLKSFSQMHEFSTMYHYFKGITDTSNDSKVVIDTKNIDSSYNIKTSSLPKHLDKKLNSNQKIQKLNSTKTQLEYMEMSSGSETERTETKHETSVTNLNYIKIETSDDKNIDEIDGIMERMNFNENELTNELKINEPPYYQSNENNLNNSNNSGSEKCNRSVSSDQFSQECSNVLENCSLSSQSEYLFQPSNVPVNLNGDYLTQPSNRPIDELIAAYKNIDNISKHSNLSNFSDSHVKMIFDKKRTTPFMSGNGTLKRSQSDVTNNKGNVDDELAEIMNDFKNNVLSIKEVEQLVEKWKNRNDVKQSFIEKQEQIDKLREEYEKIQENMKDRMKRPTPFERVKKLFSRNKSKDNIEINSISHHNQRDDLDETKLSARSSQSSSQRPISSLSSQSVSSSSSSGRMSTGSACSGASLGDSGTHSDHDERNRLQMFSSNCRIGSPGSLVENYLVPPAPRPVLSPISNFSDDKDRLTFTTGFRCLNSPISPSGIINNSAEHYIIFPSNVPVFQQENQPSSLNTIIEAKEMPNDSQNQNKNHNIAVPTPIKLKYLQEKNIIYGKLTKQNSKDVFTSFKPQSQAQAQAQVQVPQQSANGNKSIVIDVEKEMNEVYQNINRLTEEKENNGNKKCVNGTSDFDEIGNMNRKNSCESTCSNTNNEINSNNSINNEESQHNYINI